MAKLYLGAGNHRLPGWTTLDGDPAVGADLTAVVPPLPDAVTAQPWAAIMAVHFIEHLRLFDARDLLRQCYSVLEPGGVLVLEQPNLAYCARVLLGLETPPPEDFEGQYSLAGFFSDPRHTDPLMLHRWGYTPESLTAELHAAGFETVSEQRAQYHHAVRDFRLEAVK